MKTIDNIPKGYKIYVFENGKKVAAREKSCLFCKHFTDMFCDFAGNVYLILCDKFLDTGKGLKGECEFWADDTLK